LPGHGNADKAIILRSGGVAAFRQKYDVGWFCEKLEKTYKVAATREAFEKAKRPGTTQVRHITIKEKGVNPSLSGASGLALTERPLVLAQHVLVFLEWLALA
jgi:hypothetical protein